VDSQYAVMLLKYRVACANFLISENADESDDDDDDDNDDDDDIAIDRQRKQYSGRHGLADNTKFTHT